MTEGVRCACAVAGGGADGSLGYERLGAQGAATVARALESGRCSLTSLNLGCEWGALVLRVAYHRAALYRCAVLGCCQPRFVTVLVTVRWYLGKNGSTLMGISCCAVLQCAVPYCTAFNMCTAVTVSVAMPGICTRFAVLSSVDTVSVQSVGESVHAGPHCIRPPCSLSLISDCALYPEAANRAVRCQALLCGGMGGSGSPLRGQPARGLSVRCACAAGGVGAAQGMTSRPRARRRWRGRWRAGAAASRR